MKKLEDTCVSYYYGFGCKRPMDMNLLQILTTGRYEDKILEIRNTEDKKIKATLKERLPLFTPSGRFRNLSASGFIEHSGFICIDIDKKHNLYVPDYGNLKDRIKELPFVAYCGRSVSGEGYYCMIPIAYPEKHTQHFYSLSEAFVAIGIAIDEACSSVVHKRFVSFDPDPYINNEAETYEGLVEELPESVKRSQTSASCCAENDPDLRHKVDMYIAALVEYQIDITEGRKNWLSIGCAFANTFDEEGREMFHAVSQFHADYNSIETDRLFIDLLGRGYSYNIGTFFHYAHKANITAYISPFADESEKSEE